MPEVLTPDDSVEKLTGRELDCTIAERIMGFDWWRSKVSGKRCLFREDRKYGWFPYRATGDEQLTTDYDHQVPTYSASIEAAMEVEDRIAELGLRSEYYRALLDLIAMSVRDRVFHHFDLIHATAEQRCRAALKAVGAE